MIAKILITLIALLHAYFLVLEMFLWTHRVGLKAFGQSPEQAKATATLAANQGLYNGFLVAGLVWSLLESTPEFALSLQIFFLSCVLLAGLFGGGGVSKKIFIIQGFPALVTLFFILVK